MDGMEAQYVCTCSHPRGAAEGQDGRYSTYVRMYVYPRGAEEKMEEAAVNTLSAYIFAKNSYTRIGMGGCVSGERIGDD